jgi:hypothetical protein
MEENKAATDKVHDLSERLASLEERTAKVEQLSKEAVNWSQLDESFRFVSSLPQLFNLFQSRLLWQQSGRRNVQVSRRTRKVPELL